MDAIIDKYFSPLYLNLSLLLVKYLDLRDLKMISKGEQLLALQLEQKPLNWQFIEQFLSVGLKFKDTKTTNEAFILALENNKLDIAKMLLENGANPNALNSMGKSYLGVAIEKENLPLVEMLVKSKADLFYKPNFFAAAPIQIALQRINPAYLKSNPSYLKIFQSILKSMGDTNYDKFDGDLKSYFNSAIRERNTSTLKALQELRLITSDQVIELISEEFLLGLTEQMKFLFEQFPSVSAYYLKSGTNNTPLDLALKNINEDLALFFLEKGALANPIHLFLAIESGLPKLVRALLEKKFDPNALNENGESPLLLAIRAGNVDVVQILLEFGASVLIANKVEPIESDAEESDVEESDADYWSLETNSPLIESPAITVANSNSIDSLPTLTEEVGGYPLSQGDQLVSNAELEPTAIGAGIDVGVDDGLSVPLYTPPSAPIQTPEARESEPSSYPEEDDGLSLPPMALLREGYEELPQSGSYDAPKSEEPTTDLSAVRTDTLLMTAVRGGNAKIVKLLIETGADVKATNSRGESALIIAEKFKNEDILKLLHDALQTEPHEATKTLQFGRMKPLEPFLPEAPNIGPTTNRPKD